MKKVLMVLGLFVLTIFSVNGVFAEEIIEPIIDETSQVDNWLAMLTEFATLKNVLSTIFSASGLLAIWKSRKVYKYFKTPEGLVKLEDFVLKIIGKVSQSPELVMNVIKILITMPVFKNLLSNAEAKTRIYRLELKDKILGMEAKLSANVFEADKLPEAIAHLQEMRDEYENTQPSE